jgi:hypothetical protein
VSGAVHFFTFCFDLPFDLDSTLSMSAASSLSPPRIDALKSVFARIRLRAASAALRTTLTVPSALLIEHGNAQCLLHRLVETCARFVVGIVVVVNATHVRRFDGSVGVCAAVTHTRALHDLTRTRHVLGRRGLVGLLVDHRRFPHEVGQISFVIRH